MVMNETNLTPEGVLNTLTESVTMMDLAMLFRENPGLIDTENGIASRIGLTSEKIREEIRKLAAINLLTSTSLGEKMYYRWNPKRDQELQGLVVSALRSR